MPNAEKPQGAARSARLAHVPPRRPAARAAVLLLTVVSIAGAIALENGARAQVRQLASVPIADSGVPGFCSSGTGFVTVRFLEVLGDGTDPGILVAQRFDRNGIALGAEIRVNEMAVTPGGGNTNACCPSICCHDNGDFVVVWPVDVGPGEQADDGFYARMFQADGTPKGDEFRLDIPVPGRLINVNPRTDVVCLADGGFVASWPALPPGSSERLFGRRVGADGMPIGDEFALSDPALVARSPQSVPASDGGFLVSWQAYPSGVFGSEVRARRFDAAASALGDEFRVNSSEDYPYHEANDAASLGGGGFVVVWSIRSDVEPTGGDGIGARILDDAAAPLGTDLTLASTPARIDTSPAVAGSDDGGFVVVWTSYQAGNLYTSASRSANMHEPGASDVRGRRFSAAGDALGPEFAVNAFTTGSQRSAAGAVAALGGGRFAVLWSRAGPADSSGSFVSLFELGPPCGDATADGFVTATDALGALQTSVGASACPECVCDVNQQGGVLASDALAILQDAVGIEPGLDCAPCTP